MIKLIWDSAFKHAYKKRVSSNDQLKKKFWDALEIFTDDPFDSQLKAHQLTGRLNGLWALSVDYDCRIVFKFVKDTSEVLLIDIGSHDEVY
ncbi:MAG: type II toxin-antitoxin system mRNA interferase toxin, RelE/StbE family [Bacteroidota bacterium]